MAEKGWHADPLTWGRGPRVFEAFLEATCPFSARAFGKFDALIERAGADLVTLKIRLLPQPWHMFSPITCRAILAASTGPGGREAAKAVMAAIYAHREEFEPEQHCSGPLLDATPHRLIARIEALSGVSLAEAFERPDLQREVKWHAKYARQNGIHVTPTFMVDGLVAPAIGSGDSVDEWIARIAAA